MKNHVTEISWGDESNAWVVYVKHRSGKTIAVYFFNETDHEVSVLDGTCPRWDEERLLQ